MIICCRQVKIMNYEFLIMNFFVTLQSIMRNIVWIIATICLLVGCGQSYEETQRKTRQQQRELQRQDSAALKIAVMPTMDCMPLYVALERGFFKKQGIDVRLRCYTAQMDCDTAIERGRVEGIVSDLVRTERMQQLGTKLHYMAATDAYWLLVTNRMARIRELNQLDDKMLAMTRYSATDMLTTAAIDSAKLKAERVYRIQINDVNVRLAMLIGNEMDAMWLTEPQATAARQQRHRIIMDSRKLDMQLGVLAFSQNAMDNEKRKKQIDAFEKAYKQAIDSLAKHGLKNYRDIAIKYCNITPSVADSLNKTIKYKKPVEPRQEDIEKVQRWLKTTNL